MSERNRRSRTDGAVRYMLGRSGRTRAAAIERGPRHPGKDVLRGAERDGGCGPGGVSVMLSQRAIRSIDPPGLWWCGPLRTALVMDGGFRDSDCAGL